MAAHGKKKGQKRSIFIRKLKNGETRVYSTKSKKWIGEVMREHHDKHSWTIYRHQPEIWTYIHRANKRMPTLDQIDACFTGRR